MRLTLDPERLRLGLAQSENEAIFWQDMAGPKPDWVAELKGLCEARGVDLVSIDSCDVVWGKAGFSDARAAALVGNMLAWLNPGGKLYSNGQVVGELKPEYFAEPNITKPKA